MNVGHNIIQLGSDPDPDKNFIIRTPPVQDGTLEIRKGTLEAPGALVATFNEHGFRPVLPVFRARRTTSQFILKATTGQLLFNIADVGAENLVDGKFIAPVTGWYSVSAWASRDFESALMTRGIMMLRGSDPAVIYGLDVEVATTLQRVACSGLVYLVEGDPLVVEIYVDTPAGGTGIAFTIGATGWGTGITAHFVGEAL